MSLCVPRDSLIGNELSHRCADRDPEAQRDRPRDPPLTQGLSTPSPFYASFPGCAKGRPRDPPLAQELSTQSPFCASSSEGLPAKASAVQFPDCPGRERLKSSDITRASLMRESAAASAGTPGIDRSLRTSTAALPGAYRSGQTIGLRGASAIGDILIQRHVCPRLT